MATLPNSTQREELFFHYGRQSESALLNAPVYVCMCVAGSVRHLWQDHPNLFLKQKEDCTGPDPNEVRV